MAIHYIQQKEIDYSKWDRCINESLNGLIYAQSWYLDIVADRWDALVEDDYSAVFPLVFRSRYFRDELYMPVLCKQLGVFSSMPVTKSRLQDFIRAIPGKFRKKQVCFNRQNSQLLREFEGYYKPVYELDLILPAEKKVRSYSQNLQSLLGMAVASKLAVMKNVSLFEFERFLRTVKLKSPDSLIAKIHKIISRLMQKNQAELLCAYGPENMICAAACFVRSNSNVILLYAGTNRFGMQSMAHYLIVDHFLNKYSSRNVTLSFDYSDRTWNEKLYRDFGAQESHYFCYRSGRILW